MKQSQGVVLLVALMIGVHAGLLAFSATRHSPTALEPALLIAGISHWQCDRFELFNVNPPLVRMAAALPVLMAGSKNDWTELHYSDSPRLEYAIGRDFIAANGERSFWLTTIGRWACIPFSVAGAVVCFLWARELYASVGAGLLSLMLWCFDPNILAHGELITNDCAAAAFGLGAGYAFWKWLKSATWAGAVCAGVALGLAILAKMTWLVLFGLWPALAITWCFVAKKRRATWAFWGQLSLMLGMAVYLINLMYGFDGSCTKVRDFSFVSEAFRGPQPDAVGNRIRESWLGGIPVPLPKQFVLGLDMQVGDLEHYESPSYLAGEWREYGWWYYYLYGLLVKVPHGTQALVVLVLASRLRGAFREDAWNELIVVAPAIVVFGVVSANTAFNHHLRYVLPCFGFGFVFLGQAVKLVGRYGKGWRLVAYVCVTCTVVSSLWTYPHLLAYFNEAAGGPRNGRKHMLHSSLDWGQDLLHLKWWLERHPEARPCELAYSGGFDARAVGMEYARPPVGPDRKAIGSDDQKRMGPLPGWYAVSVNDIWAWSPEYHYFQHFQPVAMAGYSIYIYHIMDDATNSGRSKKSVSSL